MKPQIVVLLLGAVVLSAVAWLVGGSAASSQPAEGKRDSGKLSPPANLKIRLAEGTDAHLDPQAKAWESVAPTRVLLNRTPRIYQTEKAKPGGPAALEVRGVRADKQTIFRLSWSDVTKNTPEAPAKRTGEVGDPDKLYKRPTERTSAFADAAGVMVPESYEGGAFPSLVMGEAKNPVRLYYWNASRGAEQLTGTGRGKVESSGKALRHKARHDGERWTMTLELPAITIGSPIAFAVWDGEQGDRNGLKMFSIWYVVD